MKLVRYGVRGAEKPGVVDGNGAVRDLSALAADINGATLQNLDSLRKADISALPLVEGVPRLGACVDGVGKIICIGLNYADHAKETGAQLPEEPIIFMKATSAINGPFDPILLPRGSSHTDWEAELGIVIGKTAKYVSMADAPTHIAGYCVVNDVSERYFQKHRCGQWTKGKSCDTFAPLGPWLVTADEIPEPQNLSVRLWVNGDLRQDGSTRTMNFGVHYLVSYLSALMTLAAGDVIATGTPPGVGLGMNPPQFLKVGDVMELEVEGLGRQRQEVIADQ
ncbi:MAG: fumarylacetoacetate hydrolase family protein [Gammaproteobacteria bacterium]